MKSKILFIIIFVLIILISECTEDLNNDYSKIDINNWAFQLQNMIPDTIAISGFDLVVMDYSRDGGEEQAFSYEEIQTIKSGGVIPIAYLSIGEAENYRFYWLEEWNENPPEWLGKENEEWKGNYAVKYWYNEWENILYAYLDKIIEQGFSGVYLDKIDEFEYWADTDNGEDEYLSESETAERMINLIINIADYCKNKIDGEFYIIPQNGEGILKYDDSSLISAISAWGVEDLFYNETEEWDNENMNWILENRLPYLDKVIAEGKTVLSVDYVDNGTGYSGINKERIDDYRDKVINKRYIPCVAISDRALDKLNIIENIQP